MMPHEESDDLSKPTAPVRPSRFSTTTQTGWWVAAAVIVGVTIAVFLIRVWAQRQKAIAAARTAAAAAKVAKIRSAPVALATPDDLKKPDPPKPPAVKEPVLRQELVKRMKAEQEARLELMRLNQANSLPTPEDRRKPEVKAAFDKMEQVDMDNLAWLKGVVERHGWPGKTLVGRDGAEGAFLIAQHAVHGQVPGPAEGCVQGRGGRGSVGCSDD
jgi:type IV secretory pathway VirB10-like protein